MIVNPPACTKRRDGYVATPVSVGPLSTSRPRVTVAKAQPAADVRVGSGSGNHARSRWSSHTLSTVVVTRTKRSPARSSSTVDTARSRPPTREDVASSTRSGSR